MTINTSKLQGDFTLEEIVKIMGITRERVRQIEQMAIKKLKYPKASKNLRDYLKSFSHTDVAIKLVKEQEDISS